MARIPVGSALIAQFVQLGNKPKLTQHHTNHDVNRVAEVAATPPALGVVGNEELIF